ncbi:proline iminopeptidase-family hydrolase [Pedobacter mucosus]|uniref:proline iminopeptidase-family hydrolase n=1 Tax=Pedobacter mucosus TaxID=2895286 RepID=UPI001EE450CA|nr:proline iminopeptidase-family hydrolase [Pedobacter mucosus]UKT65609.1 proline iminopeptidase-family hydrolase [Pedobacter mucosus]
MIRYVMLWLSIFVFQQGYSQPLELERKRLNDSSYVNAIKADGVKMVGIRNQKYKVWTKRNGTGKIKVLLLHGGPGTSPEYFDNFPASLGKDYTIIFYSQLGTYFSDIPADSSLYDINSFVNDVEEVRKSQGLDQFYLLGHSWGSQLAQAYAAKFQKHIKGLILCNNINEKDEVIDDYQSLLYADILDSIPAFKKYADSLRFGFSGKFTDFNDPNALGNQIRKEAWPIMIKRHYARIPGSMPISLQRSKEHSIGGLMADLGFMKKINATDFDKYLVDITIPTLFIGAKYDFIPPYYYVKMRNRMTKNNKVEIYICPKGSHFAMWDDSDNFFNALNKFILKTEGNSIDGQVNPLFHDK